jgi:hypothetical protein
MLDIGRGPHYLTGLNIRANHDSQLSQALPSCPSSET